MLKDSQETRYYVQIRIGNDINTWSNDLVYFRNQMTMDFVKKWKWFFEYRAALLKVKNPRLNVDLYFNSYIYELPSLKYEVKLKNLVTSKKAKLTQFNNKLNKLKSEWNSLFPIEEEPDYHRISVRLYTLERELEEQQSKLDDFYKNGYVQSEQITTYIDRRIKA